MCKLLGCLFFLLSPTLRSITPESKQLKELRKYHYFFLNIVIMANPILRKALFIFRLYLSVNKIKDNYFNHFINYQHIKYLILYNL